MNGRERLADLLSADVLAALDAFVDERIAEGLSTTASNGHGRWVSLEDGAELAGCSVDALRMRIKRRPDNYRTRHEGSRVFVARADIDPEP